MISPETPPAAWAPRGAHAQSSRKRIIMAITTLLLAIGFVFAGASTATATPTLTNSHTTAPCRGDQPGFCPSPSQEKPGEEVSTHQSDDSSTTRRSTDDR